MTYYLHSSLLSVTHPIANSIYMRAEKMLDFLLMAYKYLYKQFVNNRINDI